MVGHSQWFAVADVVAEVGGALVELAFTADADSGDGRFTVRYLDAAGRRRVLAYRFRCEDTQEPRAAMDVFTRQLRAFLGGDADAAPMVSVPAPAPMGWSVDASIRHAFVAAGPIRRGDFVVLDGRARATSRSRSAPGGVVVGVAIEDAEAGGSVTVDLCVFPVWIVRERAALLHVPGMARAGAPDNADNASAELVDLARAGDRDAFAALAGCLMPAGEVDECWAGCRRRLGFQ